MVTSFLLPEGKREGKREGGYDLCPSVPWKWRRVRQSLGGNGKGVAMANSLTLPEGGWARGHDLCPSYPEKWRDVAMAITHPSSRRKEAKKEGR